MAKLPNGARVRLPLSTGDAFIILREPTNEEMNAYQAEKFNVSDNAGPGDVMMHTKRAQGKFFDLLLTEIEDLEDDQGPVTVERKDVIPLNYKAEIVFRRFDRVPIALDEKN